MIRSLLCFSLALTLLSCGDDPPASTAPSAAGSAAKAPAGTPGPAKPEAPAASAAPAGPPPKFEIVEAEFTESERSRDPFRSFKDAFGEETHGTAKSQREVVLSQFTIDELKLIGIVTRVQPARAMLVDPQGTGHVVHRGQFVGRADIVQAAGRTGASYEINWRVDRIRDGDIVLIREDPANPDVPSATRVIPLRPEGSEVKGR
ncbi:MAG TPA: pilus assembly protein PilP [Polyangiaceae bacterium]|nr:pilus assembly protein PilP [Polyangiaceae bacterium]